ncbi:unnamed protein product [Effrenium voratum]|nr:unnamed protein product [Effrenium voratum]
MTTEADTAIALFRSAVLGHLRASEERAQPLTMLGNIEEVQRTRKGLGNLRKALLKLEEVELVEEGQPPELVVRLKPEPPEPEPEPERELEPGEQSLARARCRVVAVLQRSPQNVGEIVALVAKPNLGRTDAADTPMKECALPDTVATGIAATRADALLAFFGLEWRGFSEESHGMGSPADVEEELRRQFPDTAAVVQSELPRRRDLRHLHCVTIDPPHAKDLDDAVSVSPGQRPGSLRVGVHIADVTHFVPPGSATDREARKRATTVYLVARAYPMLPRWLSENLCSLLPDGDRLSFSVFFSITENGELDTTEPPEMCRRQ